MTAELINIGDELLIGQTVNTNASWLGEQLSMRGVKVKRVWTIQDERNEIIETLDSISADTRWVIITGGLGPTKDDLTKNTLVNYFGDRLVFSEDTMAHIESLFARMNRVPNEVNREQAMLPVAAESLRNDMGTAPGMLWQRDEQFIVSIPGVPYEMRHVFERHLAPRIDAERSQVLEIHHFWIQGVPESELAARLETIESSLPEMLHLAYLPSPGHIRLQLRAVMQNDRLVEGRETLAEFAQRIRQVLGADVYSESQEPMESVIGSLLAERGETLATAESCTGGLVASMITSVSGSSAYFKGAVVAYANEVKVKQLGVNEADLMMDGAVSREVVRAMARGVRKRLGTDWGVASSGVAGPTGGTEAKPVGMVWLAVIGPDYEWVECLHFGTHRQRTVQRSALTLLNQLRLGLLAKK